VQKPLIALLLCLIIFFSSGHLLFDLLFPIPAQEMKEESLMQQPHVLSIELILATHVPMAELSKSLKPCSRIMNLKVASEGIRNHDEALQSTGQHATTLYAHFITLQGCML